MCYRLSSYSYFTNNNETSTRISEEESSSSTPKMRWIHGIALACFALAAWNFFQRRAWVAIALSIGGCCLEVALQTLRPSKTDVDAPQDVTSPQDLPEPEEETPATDDRLTSAIDHLEACYPVIKVVNLAQIKDQQAGGMMGQACGDAIGLFTEFTTAKEAKAMIKGQPIELGPKYSSGFVNGANWSHIKRFVKNGWTDDTDQALSLLRALYRKLVVEKDSSSLSFAQLFARELIKWRKGGLKSEQPFIGREKAYCMGLGALVASVLNVPMFLKDPHGTAEKVWAKNLDMPLQHRPAANGAIMRTAPIGLIFYHSFEDVVSYTIEACKVTHADPRCTASCVAFTLAIAMSLRGYDRDAIFKVAEEGGLAVLRQELELAAQKKLLPENEIEDLDTLYETIAEEFKSHLNGDWKKLDLDEGYKVKGQINKIGYTFKCMGAAFYALTLADKYQQEQKSDIFRTIIEEIAAEGGDADTNGAAAGALLGAYLGLKGQFPANWTSHIADSAVLDQAIEHIEELSSLSQ